MTLIAKVGVGRRRRGAEVELYEDGERITTLKGMGGEAPVENVELPFWKGKFYPSESPVAPNQSVNMALEETENGGLGTLNYGRLELPDGWYMAALDLAARKQTGNTPVKMGVQCFFGSLSSGFTVPADRFAVWWAVSVGPFRIDDAKGFNDFGIFSDAGTDAALHSAEVVLLKIG